MKCKIKNLLEAIAVKIDRIEGCKGGFVVISNNCWGGGIYRRLNLPYNTPFVGLYMYGPDYIKLLENFDSYMSHKMEFIEFSRWLNNTATYPIGLLKDVEVHFLHYKDRVEAMEKWNRRLSRMNKIKDRDKYFFKIDDRDFSDDDIIQRFHALPFKNKISFGLRKLDIKNHIQILENENGKNVPDGAVLYRISFKYFDVFKWINSGKIKSNWYSVIKAKCKIT